MNDILNILRHEKDHHRKGGLYHQTQILFAYNSNRIEGSKLTHEQTRYIYETNTFLPDGNAVIRTDDIIETTNHFAAFDYMLDIADAPLTEKIIKDLHYLLKRGTSDEVIRTDDIIETTNHFAAFDYMLDIADAPLTEKIIKDLHYLLKRGTSDERDPTFNVGEYKSLPNMIGEMVYTTSPSEVPVQIKKLLEEYQTKQTIKENDIIDFHYRFERIHPFQDGNGRVGRLIMFKECLAHNLIPFVIDSEHKLFYYRGLREYPTEPGFLTDTCLSAQDSYKHLISYFFNQPTIDP